MSKVRNYFLVKKYPWLQCRNVWSGEKLGYDFIWIDDMPKGWKKAFGMKIVKEIDSVLGDFRNEYQISQIKEKFGSLRWYDNGAPSEIYDKLCKIIDKYEEISKHTCMICGKHGEIDYKESWLSPLCNKCREKVNNGKL